MITNTIRLVKGYNKVHLCAETKELNCKQYLDRAKINAQDDILMEMYWMIPSGYFGHIIST